MMPSPLKVARARVIGPRQGVSPSRMSFVSWSANRLALAFSAVLPFRTGRTTPRRGWGHERIGRIAIEWEGTALYCDVSISLKEARGESIEPLRIDGQPFDRPLVLSVDAERPDAFLILQFTKSCAPLWWAAAPDRQRSRG